MSGQMEEIEPYNFQAEAAFVGAFFLDDDLVKECTIHPEQLYSRKLRLLYTAIRNLAEKEKPVDVISVVDELGTYQLEEIGGVSFISKLACSVPTTSNFHFYEKMVREYDQKRKAIQIAGKIIEQAGVSDISKTLSNGIQELMIVEEQTVEDEDTGNLQESLVELYLESEQDLGEIVGIPSGFSHLDKLTGGFRESDFVIIGARPSVGKTAFALNIAMNAAIHDIGLIFSLEMSKKQLVKRLTGMTGGIDSLKMKNPKREFGDEDWQNFSKAIGKIEKAKLHIFDQAGMDVPYIWSKVRKMRREYGGTKRMLVVIDYLQLIEGEAKPNSNRQTEISEISRKLKTMARELDVVVIALSQLSRGVESRQDKRPLLSDLRDSGQIEQDADIIAFLYREDYYTKDPAQNDKLEVILAKHRNGPTGTVELRFNKRFGQFANVV